MVYGSFVGIFVCVVLTPTSLLKVALFLASVFGNNVRDPCRASECHSRGTRTMSE